MGIEPTPSAWKAEVLPLNYTRMRWDMEGEGFEPSKAEPSDLQSDPFDRSGTPPQYFSIVCFLQLMSTIIIQKHYIVPYTTAWYFKVCAHKYFFHHFMSLLESNISID